ncbi:MULTISPECIES: heme-dependent oxidative N-demethylase subunit alpha family protein [Ramlibacter]|uniref:DUF3445 domain-containing protein n=1 Tax=Ramlibacter aquaticus TaxID=2780094 RepID=A0ABR9SB98_9BURK|nr:MULTISPECIES: heme-dependent oxidative N-demethylase subunit alpha family protein [Ramlibacter]MBE7939603.1 DUF3445 domain-containing protein [Ramlibacter aquaticus]
MTGLDLLTLPVPFRMQPGLRRLPAGDPQLVPLQAGSRLWAEKQAVFEAGRSRFMRPGFDPGPALEAIAGRLPGHGAGLAPELAFEQDFAVLDGADGTLPWLAVCVPSHWAPEEKIGLDFATLHGPVADNAALVAATRGLVQLATGGECWERWVWTVSPSPRYDQHPGRHPREPWPEAAEPAEFAARCWWRTERQSFFPVGRGTRQAVFAIHVQLAPLTQAVADPLRARRLHDSLASMSPAVLAYKGLAAAQPRLLQWLARIS